MIAVTEATVGLIFVSLITAGASIAAAWISSRARREAATGNDKPIGHTVHDMAQSLEIVQAQAQANAADLIGLHERAAGVQSSLDELSAKVDEHLTQTQPLVDVFLQEHPELDRRED